MSNVVAAGMTEDLAVLPRAPRVMQVVLSLGVGGTERLVIELVKRLSGSVAFSVCCLDEPGVWAAELAQRGVPIAVLQRSAGFHPRLGLRLARLCRELEVDVLHCHHYSPFVYGQLAALFNRRLRVIFTEHGRLSDAPPSPKRKLANVVLRRLGARICAVSQHLREHMGGEGLGLDNIRVIPNGIDPDPRDSLSRCEARARLGLGAAAEVLGTVARLDAVKDLETMIAAFAILGKQRSTARLVIVGDGPERQRLEAYAATVGVGDAVMFCGQRSDVRALLPAFDVYLNSSISEGISIAILEGMAAGLPVVATGVGGNPEVVEDGRQGYVVPVGNPRAFAAAAAALLESPRRRTAFGEAARARVVEHFTFDRMVDAYLETYVKQGSC